MLSDDIRTRLRRLHQLGPGTTATLTPHCTAASATNWLAQGREIANDSGKHLQLRRTLADDWPRAHAAVARLTDKRATPGRLNGASHHELEALAEHFPTGTLFLDLETCGFAGSIVFLAGLVWHLDGTLVIDQLLARDYAEEGALLETLWRTVEKNRVLVTFNGKSFDWPMVRDRSTRHRLVTSSGNPTIASRPRRDLLHCDLLHCDLLHHARRRWKRLLPNCKLQTLERYVCNRRRHGDLSGDQVPAAYHAFVRSGDGHQMGHILQHNALDLVTLVEIAVRLASA